MRESSASWSLEMYALASDVAHVVAIAFVLQRKQRVTSQIAKNEFSEVLEHRV